MSDFCGILAQRHKKRAALGVDLNVLLEFLQTFIWINLFFSLFTALK